MKELSPLESNMPVVLLASQSLRQRIIHATGNKFRPRGFLLDAVTFGKLDNLFIAGPVLGGPGAALTLQELLRRGFSRFHFVGTCGALNFDSNPILPGSFLSPLFFWRDSQTKSGEQEFPPLPPPLRPLREARRVGFWTTDWHSREDISAAHQAFLAGPRAVEMEGWWLSQVATRHDISMEYSFVVTDCWSKMGWQAHFQKRPVLDALEQLAISLTNSYFTT